MDFMTGVTCYMSNSKAGGGGGVAALTEVPGVK